MSRMRLVFFGLLAVLAVSAAASASASAGPYVFLKGGASPLMGSLELQTTQVGSAKLNGTLAGTAVEISCELAKSEKSTAENVLTAGIEHVLGLSLLHYTMCTVPKPAGHGCLVHNELIRVHTHVLGVAGPLVRFSPETAGIFTQITVDGCDKAALNNTFPVEGSASAIPNNTNSTLEFTASSGSALLFGGNPATFVANYKIEMKGGGELEFK